MARAEDGSSTGAVGYVFGALAAAALPGPILLPLLADLGVQESAARTMLSRMVRAGQLSSKRQGRVAVYALAGGYRERFLRLRYGDVRSAWTGAFDTVLYDIAERHRHQRDDLRALAFAAGFGALRPGVLIGFGDPSTWVADLPEPASADGFVAVGRLQCDVGTARALVGWAWPITELVDVIDRQLERLAALWEAADTDPVSALRAHHAATGQLAAAQFRAPNLPSELAPEGWHADALSEAYAQLSARLWPAIVQRLDSVTRSSAVADLMLPLERPITSPPPDGPAVVG